MKKRTFKLRKIEIIALGVFFIISPTLVFGQTVGELQGQIQALLARLAVLEGQLGSNTSAGGSAEGLVDASAPIICPALSRALALGSRGEDVASLQRFLASNAFLSTDSVTGYFGSFTREALRAWQATNGIVSGGDEQSTGWGALGPRTRAMILAQCGLRAANGGAVLCSAIAAQSLCPAGQHYESSRDANGCEVLGPCVPNSTDVLVTQTTVSPTPSTASIQSETTESPSVSGDFSLSVSSPIAGHAFVVGDAIPVSWQASSVPSSAAMYLQLVNNSDGSVVKSQKVTYTSGSASLGTGSGCNGSFSDGIDGECFGLRSAIGKNLIFYFVQAVIYTPSNACLGFCAPGTGAATTLLTAKSGVFTLKSAAFSASPTSGFAPLNVIFSGNVPVGYFGGVKIDFGDGSEAASACNSGAACTYQVTHAYASAGTYTATLSGRGEGGPVVLGTAKISTARASTSGCDTTNGGYTISQSLGAGAYADPSYRATNNVLQVSPGAGAFADPSYKTNNVLQVSPGGAYDPCRGASADRDHHLANALLALEEAVKGVLNLLGE